MTTFRSFQQHNAAELHLEYVPGCSFEDITVAGFCNKELWQAYAQYLCHGHRIEYGQYKNELLSADTALKYLNVVLTAARDMSAVSADSSSFLYWPDSIL